MAQWSSVVECLTRDRGAASSSLNVVSLSKKINPSLVLVQPRKTRPFITERLLMGRKESNQTNKQWYNTLSYARIQCSIQEISYKTIFWSKFDMSNCPCDLDNWVNVTKIELILPLLPTMYLCEFGQNTSAGSEDNAWKPYFGHFKVPMWPWKLGQAHLYSSSQQCIFASLVKIHPLV